MRVRGFSLSFLLNSFLILLVFLLSVRCNNNSDSVEPETENEIKTVFVLGDSISIHYHPFLEKYLAGYLVLVGKKDDGRAEKNLNVPGGADAGDSRLALAYLQAKVKDAAFHPDYILFNCGLDDIKRNLSTNQNQVSEQEYRKNLEAIVRLVAENKMKLIWIRTTPVVDYVHNTGQVTFRRYAADVKLYNQIADEVCAKNKIPKVDLFSFSEKLGTGQLTDHVHYTESARDLQGAFIAGNVLSYLNIFRIK